MKLVIATTNAGKLREYRELLAGFELLCLADFPPQPEVVEDGADFLANACKKAVTYALALQRSVLADDSGLVVDALGGAPGVLSARFAGASADDAANLAKVLALMADVPDEQRSARFQCVIVVARPDGATLVGSGACEGRVAPAGRGTGGFGYDPIFIDAESGRTFAELEPAEKNRRSHRARALAQIRAGLADFLAGEVG
ncbi:MAG TPA: XTP/dITP diphosphatase [Terriglobales bacterium]|nr:XTP/dITP diphosphatase [Terriglobales bacterium]